MSEGLKVSVRKVFLLLFGPICALLGLAEVIRLVLMYWGEYGLFIGFPLEVGVYAVGVAWVIYHYLMDAQRILSYSGPIQTLKRPRELKPLASESGLD